MRAARSGSVHRDRPLQALRAPAAGATRADRQERHRQAPTARKTRTKKGAEIYKRRKAIVEPVFGQIDTVQDGRRVLIRGKPAARAQWRFTCAIHNLLKLYRAGGLVLVNTS